MKRFHHLLTLSFIVCTRGLTPPRYLPSPETKRTKNLRIFGHCEVFQSFSSLFSPNFLISLGPCLSFSSLSTRYPGLLRRRARKIERDASLSLPPHKVSPSSPFLSSSPFPSHSSDASTQAEIKSTSTTTITPLETIRLSPSLNIHSSRLYLLRAIQSSQERFPPTSSRIISQTCPSSSSSRSIRSRRSFECSSARSQEVRIPTRRSQSQRGLRFGSIA